MPLATLALQLLIAGIQNLAGISQLIANAKAQNRDITLEELQSIVELNNVAHANLVIAIANAKAAGK